MAEQNQETKIFYLCDGQDPRCDNDEKKSMCWKYDDNSGCTRCRHTDDINHALHFHKSKKMGYWKERGQEDDSSMFDD